MARTMVGGDHNGSAGSMKSLDQRKYTVAVDFDGVLHTYSTKWESEDIIRDAPVPGALAWLYEMIQDFDVIVFTTRGKTKRGRTAVLSWIQGHVGKDLWQDEGEKRGLCRIGVKAIKPPALVYIDDRAYRFTGANFPTVQEIHQMRPWNK